MKYAMYKLDPLDNRVFTITTDNIDAATWKAKIGLGITDERSKLQRCTLLTTSEGVRYLVKPEDDTCP